MKKLSKLSKLSIISALAATIGLAGCGTQVGSDLAGVNASFDVAQKGKVAAVTVTGNGTNAVTIGVAYSQGSNSYTGSTTISSNAVTVAGSVTQGTNTAAGSVTIPGPK